MSVLIINMTAVLLGYTRFQGKSIISEQSVIKFMLFTDTNSGLLFVSSLISFLQSAGKYPPSSIRPL